MTLKHLALSHMSLLALSMIGLASCTASTDVRTAARAENVIYEIPELIAARDSLHGQRVRVRAYLDPSPSYYGRWGLSGADSLSANGMEGRCADVAGSSAVEFRNGHAPTISRRDRIRDRSRRVILSGVVDKNIDRTAVNGLFFDDQLWLRDAVILRQDLAWCENYPLPT